MRLFRKSIFHFCLSFRIFVDINSFRYMKKGLVSILGMIFGALLTIIVFYRFGRTPVEGGGRVSTPNDDSHHNSIEQELLYDGTKGIWNPETGIYMNPGLGITWTLPVIPGQLEWIETSSEGKHIVFKASSVGFEYDMMALVSVRDDQVYGTDIWEHFSVFQDELDRVKSQAESSGIFVYDLACSKSELGSFHSVKMMSDVDKFDKTYGRRVNVTDISQHILHKNKLLTFDLQGYLPNKEGVKDAFYANSVLAFRGVTIE